MGCQCQPGFETQGPCDRGLPQINQGTTLNPTKVISLTLLDRSTKKPVDLSTASAIVVNFPATNTQGYIQKTLGAGVVVVSPGQLGQCEVTLQSADVALLTPGVISFVAYVTNASLSNEPCQLLNAIQVNQPPFAGA